jgi:formamidopyrimidine-DNA glycosylase
MPELPEVETVVRGLAPHLEGRVLKSVRVGRPDLRFPFPPRFAERLQGRRVVSVGRRAKYALVALDSGEVWLMHLGMSGRVLVEAAPRGAHVPLAHDHVVIETDGGARIVFNDARRFGFMDLFPAGDAAANKHLAGLGPEPLGEDFSVDSLEAALAGKKTPIKAALLDQRVVAGLGNIYVCEALFRGGISPKRSAASVKGERAKRLVPAIKAVLTEAIAAGGSTLRDYVQSSGELGYFQHSFSVYGREGEACTVCAEKPAEKPVLVRRIVQSGRSSFYCPACQR